MPLTKDQREVKRLRRHLQSLTDGVLILIHEMDALMQTPSTTERGNRRFAGLGVSYRRDNKRKAVAAATRRAKRA